MSNTNSAIKSTLNLQGVVLFGNPSDPGVADSIRRLKLAGREYLFEEEEIIAADLCEQKEKIDIDEMIAYCQNYINDLKKANEFEPEMARNVLRLEMGILEILKEKRQSFQL